MNRILFAKTGRAVFISHLDLMRTMQRAFIRAGVRIRHTEGFNPHPYMNFALPLSLGVESRCELMEFALEGEAALADLPTRLNAVLPEGIEVLDAYVSDTKFKYIKWLDIEAHLFYYNEVHQAEELAAFFARPELVTEKRTKRQTASVDIKPLIAALEVTGAAPGELLLTARLSAQEPSLSPAQLLAAVEQLAPALKPDHVRVKRLEVFDKDMNIFR